MRVEVSQRAQQPGFAGTGRPAEANALSRRKIEVHASEAAALESFYRQHGRHVDSSG